MTSSDLSELIERLKAATGPDRELDMTIENTLNIMRFEWEPNHYGIGDGEHIRKIPFTFTASIDAALALVERCLPGVWYVLAKGRMTSAEPLYGCELLFGHDTQLAIAEGDTQALAILLALLTALEGKQQ